MVMLRLLILAIALALGLIATGLVGPNRPAIESEFGLSHFQFGLGLAVIQMVVATAVLLGAGRLKKFHPVTILRTAITVQIIGLLMCGVGTSLSLLILGWAITITGTMLSSIANNVSMDLWPDNPRRGVVLLHAWIAVGKFVGPIVAAGFLLIGWRLSFVASAGGIVLMLLLSTGVRKVRSGVAFDTSTAPDTHAFAIPRYWIALVCIGLIAGGEAAFVTLLPTYYHEAEGMTESWASVLLSVHLAGLVAGRFAAAALADRLSNNAILAICLAAGVFVFPAVLIEAPAVRLPALALMGLMFSSTWPTFYAQATAHLREHRHMLAYGVGLANQAGIAGCVLLSSAIADVDLLGSMWFGPAVLWGFGVVYVTSGMGRSVAVTPA